MELTQSQIAAINKECIYNQGIFREPFGIPNHIKDLVIYTRWSSGGRPGSCWDDEDTVNEVYSNDRPGDAYNIIELILKELGVDDAVSVYSNEIQGLIQSNTETEYGYYGDYTEDTIEWIELSYFFEILNTLIIN